MPGKRGGTAFLLADSPASTARRLPPRLLREKVNLLSLLFCSSQAESPGDSRYGPKNKYSEGQNANAHTINDRMRVTELRGVGGGVGGSGVLLHVVLFCALNPWLGHISVTRCQ